MVMMMMMMMMFDGATEQCMITAACAKEVEAAMLAVVAGIVAINLYVNIHACVYMYIHINSGGGSSRSSSSSKSDSSSSSKSSNIECYAVVCILQGAF